ncbi:MAG: T9SS type A sorting domain-containing protein [Bacteroidota bacterium]|nr:T9SS type A sorting domain-containing protein [Bacteroidota bacterium]
MKVFLLSVLGLMLVTPVLCQVGDLIWSDEFNNGELDLSKWSYETGTGVNGDFGTGQVDRATDRELNVSFQDGITGAEDACLVITTRKEFYIDRDYTSGRIMTAGKASWGPGHKIVARVMPRDVRYQGQGFAFWMMPDETPDGYDYIMWPQGGEIDIMEYVGAFPYNNLGTVHYAWFWEDNQYRDWNHGILGIYYSYQCMEVPDPNEPEDWVLPPATDDPDAGSTEFHNYGIDWYDDRLEFFIDDNVYHVHYLDDGGGFQIDGQDEKAIRVIDGRRTGVSEYSNHFNQWHPFEHKMFLILSAGVGGSEYTYGGPIVPEAEFPCSVFIDWVRVFEIGDPGLDINNISSTPEIHIYPNPANNLLNLEIDDHKEYRVRIVDLSGRTVLSTRINKSGMIDVSVIEPGEYIVLISDGKMTISKKIIKK